MDLDPHPIDMDPKHLCRLTSFCFRLRLDNSSKLEGEYRALVEGLREAQTRRETEQEQKHSIQQ